MGSLRVGAAMAVLLSVATGVARAQDVAPVASESAASLFERVVGEAHEAAARFYRCAEACQDALLVELSAQHLPRTDYRGRVGMLTPRMGGRNATR